MKFPKIHHTSTIAQPDEFEARMPQWISEIGLEWLYELILWSENLWRTKLTRHS